MLPFQVPAQIQPPQEQFVPLPVAIERLLDEYDQKGEGRPLTPASVLPLERPSLHWLLDALTKDLPENPFPKGSRSQAEAEALRGLLQGGDASLETRLASLTFHEAGTQLGLWRWGRRLARAGQLRPAARLAWETALLTVPNPTLATGYALRHALSFALADDDLARFAALKAAHSADAAEVFLDFQRLFGLIGTPGPNFHFRALPGFQPVEKSLKDLGGDRIWICPADASKPTRIPEGTAWIVPRSGETEAAFLQEADALLRRNPTAGPRIWFATEHEVFDAYGMVIFPLLVTTDFRGFITAIRIGEAAPQQP